MSISAFSPEARGRSERVFRTLQDRLPKELALAEIREMAAANQPDSLTCYLYDFSRLDGRDRDGIYGRSISEDGNSTPLGRRTRRRAGDAGQRYRARRITNVLNKFFT